MTRRIGLFDLREHLRGSLWFLPTLIVMLGAGVALLLLAVDRSMNVPHENGFVFGGRADAARQAIAIIAGSMVSFIGTVFSVTVIVLQLASSQFSPRALRSFLRDRRSQVPLGVFLGSLVYSLVVLWSIRSAGGGGNGTEFVPHLSISGAFLLVLVSLATFVFYINHVSQSIRVANVVHRIGHETLEVLEKRYPHPFDPAAQSIAPDSMRGEGHAIASSSYGVVLAYDCSALVCRAEELGGRVELLAHVGDFVAIGQPLAMWTGDLQALESLRLEDHVSLGRERTMEQDLAFGLRQLVDVAEKALSPGVNDPTTATQALDQIHNVLRQLAQRTFPNEIHKDDAGTPRVIVHERTWEDFVRAGFAEIRQYGDRSLQIQDRLQTILSDLAASVPEQRRTAVYEQVLALEPDVLPSR